MAKEFDIESFAAEERMMLDNFTTDSANSTDPVLINSTGPVTSAMEIEMQKETVRYKYIGNLSKIVRIMNIISGNNI